MGKNPSPIAKVIVSPWLQIMVQTHVLSWGLRNKMGIAAWNGRSERGLKFNRMEDYTYTCGLATLSRVLIFIRILFILHYSYAPTISYFKRGH